MLLIIPHNTFCALYGMSDNFLIFTRKDFRAPYICSHLYLYFERLVNLPGSKLILATIEVARCPDSAFQKYPLWNVPNRLGDLRSSEPRLDWLRGRRLFRRNLSWGQLLPLPLRLRRWQNAWGLWLVQQFWPRYPHMFHLNINLDSSSSSSRSLATTTTAVIKMKLGCKWLTCSAPTRSRSAFPSTPPASTCTPCERICLQSRSPRRLPTWLQRIVADVHPNHQCLIGFTNLLWRLRYILVWDFAPCTSYFLRNCYIPLQWSSLQATTSMLAHVNY